MICGGKATKKTGVGVERDGGMSEEWAAGGEESGEVEVVWCGVKGLSWCGMYCGMLWYNDVA